MSRMQEASDPVEYNYAQLTKSISPEANNQERTPWVSEDGSSEESHFRRSHRDSAVWIVKHPIARDERNVSANKEGESPQMDHAGAPDRKRHSQPRSRSVRGRVSLPLPFGQNETDSLGAQIRKFKEREDLRECLIPGMVGGISQKACEGWRRQTTARSARLMAKIKLGPCKDCKYFSEPSASPAKRKN
jgi:hypothetical protein